METDELQLQEYYNEIIENYISFATILNEGGFVCLHLVLRLRAGGGIADLDMALARMDLSNHDHIEEFTEQQDEIKGIQLFEAARYGDQTRTIQLLESNPTLMFYRIDGNTILHVVALQGNKSFVKKLIDFINVNKHSAFLSKSPHLAVNDDNNTALHLALKFKYKEVAYELIKEMPEPKIAYAENKYNEMPITLAIRKSYMDLVEDIFKRAPWSSLCQRTRENLLHSPIVHDAMKVNLGMLQIVLDNMPDLAESTFEKTTPLTYALVWSDVDKVRYLLKEFPKTATKCNMDGKFPIHWAVLGEDNSRSVDLVKELISCVPETLYQVDSEGKSILHVVIEYTKPQIFSYLRTLPQLKEIYHYKDVNGNTFLDTMKQQMGIYFKEPSRSSSVHFGKDDNKVVRKKV